MTEVEPTNGDNEAFETRHIEGPVKLAPGQNFTTNFRLMRLFKRE